MNDKYEPHIMDEWMDEWMAKWSIPALISGTRWII